MISTKYVEPATNFVTLFYIGAVTQIVSIMLLYWFKEELDVENLAKRNAVVPKK